MSFYSLTYSILDMLMDEKPGSRLTRGLRTYRGSPLNLVGRLLVVVCKGVEGDIGHIKPTDLTCGSADEQTSFFLRMPSQLEGKAS